MTMLQTTGKPIISLEPVAGGLSTVAAVVIASPTENKANLFGLVAPNSQPGPNREHTKRRVAFSGLTDGSSHSCPELRVRQRAWVSKGEKGRQR